MSTNPTFLLVHGAWHDGGCWSAVAERLSDAGFPSATPTLAGHDTDADRGSVTHDDYVSSVLEALDDESGPVVLVGRFSPISSSRPRPRRPGLLVRLVTLRQPGVARW